MCRVLYSKGMDTDRNSAGEARSAGIMLHFEVFDGRGIATVWTCKRFTSGRTEIGECIGSVIAHTVAEAEKAWKATV